MNLMLPLSTTSCAVAGLLLAAAATAQTTVTFPSDHATLEGQYSATNFPYAYGVSRLLAVYESWDLGIAPNTPISRIGVRQNGTTASTGRAVQLEVRMGYTTRTAANLSTSYDSNYAGAAQTVFGPALFTLPTLTNNPPGQQVVWLDLTTPFVFQPANGNLLIEWRVIANNNGNASFTYQLDRANFHSPVTSSPQPGCPHSGNQTAVLTSQPASVGSSWRIAVNNAPASTLVFLGVQIGGNLAPGYSLQGLIPGIQSSCLGFLTGNFPVFTATTNVNGYHQWTVQIPNDRSFNDLTMASQVIVPDFFAPGGYVVSNGDHVQFGIDPAQTFVYSQGNVNATTGTLWQNYGLVTLFQ